MLFRQECVFCHGVSARGGMRGPDLTTGAWSHGGSDEELAATITDGVPGTAMPAHAHLKEEEIGQIIAYLRTLQQPVDPVPRRRRARRDAVLRRRALRRMPPREGPRRQGRPGAHDGGVGAVARLSHRVHSRARALPDRTRGHRRSGGRRYDTVTAVTNDGRKIVGVAMNEDTFTVQIMDTADRIHSLRKRDLKDFRHEDRSVMPAYSEAQLNGDALDDLVAYLQTLRASTPAKKGGPQ